MKNQHFFILILFIFGFAACTNVPDRGDIVSRPPYSTLTDSIKRFPDNTGLRFRRAQLLSQNNQHELAYDDYRYAWEKQPTEEVAMAYISNLFLINKPNEAVAILEKAAAKFPGNSNFRRRLSEAYIENGLSKKALEQYNSILKRDSSNFEAWYEKGLLLTEMDDTPGAIDALQHSYTLQPLAMNGIALANLYAETYNPMAVSIADELIRKDSVSARLNTESLAPYFVKGIYYSNTKQYKHAIEQFDSCIRKDWKFTDAYIEKGIVLFEQKNIDEALQAFKLAATVSPRNADAYYWLGRSYEAIGKKEDAIDNYTRAYALDRNFREAKEHLDKLKKEKG